MGTCFTKTEYVTGRQTHYHIAQQQQHTDQQSSSVALSHLEHPADQSEAMLSTPFNFIDKPYKVHGSGRDIQSKYNRWIARKQQLFHQSSDPTVPNSGEVNTGKNEPGNQ